MMRVPEHWAWTRAEDEDGEGGWGAGAGAAPSRNATAATAGAEVEANSDDDIGRDERLAQVEVGVLGALFVLTVLGNAVVLLALYGRRRCGGRRKLSRMFYFILHLSVADMVTAFFSVLPQLVWKVTFRFHGGNVLCKAVKFSQPLGVYLSSYVLTATALDRYRAICHPLTYCSWSSSRAHAMVGAAWGLSLLFCLPQVFIFSIEPVEGGYDCWATFVPEWGQRAYVTWYTCSVFMVPLTVLLFTYSRICCEIWRSAATSKHAPTMVDGTCKTCPHVHAYAYRFAPHHQPQPVSSNSFALARSQQHAQHRTNPLISRAKINTVKQTVLVIAIYIICSAPFICVQLWAAWGNADNPFFQGRYMTILTLLFSLNSCVNPWIYLAFNKDLVRMLWLLVSCKGGHFSSSGHVLSAHSGGSHSGSSQQSNTQHRSYFTDLNNHVPGPATALGTLRRRLLECFPRAAWVTPTDTRSDPPGSAGCREREDVPGVLGVPVVTCCWYAATPRPPLTSAGASCRPSLPPRPPPQTSRASRTSRTSRNSGPKACRNPPRSRPLLPSRSCRSSSPCSRTTTGRVRCEPV